MSNKSLLQFNFGRNWKDFSDHAVTTDTLVSAQESLTNLIPKSQFRKATFLDIGSGSGLFTLAAKKLGATKAMGIDISPDSIQSAQQNATRFHISGVRFIQGSILSPHKLTPLGSFDIVYSWGVLHHTGDMWTAITNATKFVKPNGTFVIAIYNRHWSSPIWVKIKYLYNIAPSMIKKILVYLFSVIIWTAKLISTRSNPFKKRRGMSFYYDVIDWLGGYPYQYASQSEIVEFLKPLGFKLIHATPPPVPTACYECVFQKKS